MFEEEPSRRAKVITAICLIALFIGFVASLVLIATKRIWAPPPSPTTAEFITPGAHARAKAPQLATKLIWNVRA